MSVIRDNLLSQPGYSPYCGNWDCDMPRTFWNGTQFECPACQWKSAFDDAFIQKYLEYKATWPK